MLMFAQIDTYIARYVNGFDNSWFPCTHKQDTFSAVHCATIVWEKFTVGYFRVKYVHGEIFSSFGVSNE